MSLLKDEDAKYMEISLEALSDYFETSVDTLVYADVELSSLRSKNVS